VLLQDDLERLVGKRPFGGQTNYQAHMAGTDRSETASERHAEHPETALDGDLPPLHLPGQPETETV
jgi:AFG3 family protein